MSWRRELAKLGVLFAGRGRWTISQKRFALISKWKSRRTGNPAMPPAKLTLPRCAGFGNVTLAQERSREMWGWNWAETLWSGPSLRPAHAPQESRLTVVAVLSEGPCDRRLAHSTARKSRGKSRSDARTDMQCQEMTASRGMSRVGKGGIRTISLRFFSVCNKR